MEAQHGHPLCLDHESMHRIRGSCESTSLELGSTEFAALIPDLYDASRFVRASGTTVPNPVPLCCPATSVPSNSRALQSDPSSDSPG